MNSLNAQIKNMLIGLFVVAACATIIGLILFIEPKVGDGKQEIHVMMCNVQNINPGTRVLLAGYPIGEVYKIERLAPTPASPVDTDKHPYLFLLTLHIDSKVPIYTNYKISIGTFGLLGEKVINIEPSPILLGSNARLVKSGDIIQGNSEDMFETAFNELTEVAASAKELLDKANIWMSKHSEEVASSIKSFGRAMDQVDTLLGDVNKDKIVADIKVVSENAAKISSQIASGHGTLGSLVMKEQTYYELNSLLSRANTIASDINNYGLLFQSNKQWQRLRAKRAALIDDLRTPQDYIAYFQDQVDTINAALGRLDTSFVKLQGSTETSSQDYLRSFRAFSTDVGSLSDSVKLLEQSLADSSQEPFCPPCQGASK